MKTAKVLIFFLLFLSLRTVGKPIVDFKKITAFVSEVPVEAESSIASLSQYLTESLPTEEEKFAAIYAWIALNIEYDVKNYRLSKITGVNLYSFSEKASIEEVWAKRKGVCSHYARLFKELSDKAGLKSHVITGYTRNNGIVSEEGHAWNAVKINSCWYLVDATWGAGYVNDKSFYFSFKPEYFMVLPSESILTRMPFDPVWQLLKETISYQEFNRGSFSKNSDSEKILSDSLEEFLALNEIDQTTATIKRMRMNGMVAGVTAKYLSNQKEKLSFLNSKEGVIYANRATAYYNSYVKSFNKRFRNPILDDNQIFALADSAESNINKALKYYHEAYIEEEMPENMKKNLQQALDQKEQIKAERAFVDKYVSTPKIFRPFLFMKWK